MVSDSELETGAGSCATGASRPRQEVVVRTVREVSCNCNTWPTLTHTNYGQWAMTMKVKL